MDKSKTPEFSLLILFFSDPQTTLSPKHSCLFILWRIRLESRPYCEGSEFTFKKKPRERYYFITEAVKIIFSQTAWITLNTYFWGEVFHLQIVPWIEREEIKSLWSIMFFLTQMEGNKNTFKLWQWDQSCLKCLHTSSLYLLPSTSCMFTLDSCFKVKAAQKLNSSQCLALILPLYQPLGVWLPRSGYPKLPQMLTRMLASAVNMLTPNISEGLNTTVLSKFHIGFGSPSDHWNVCTYNQFIQWGIGGNTFRAKEW